LSKGERIDHRQCRREKLDTDRTDPATLTYAEITVPRYGIAVFLYTVDASEVHEG
jgi:hypothetical protein